MDVGPDSTLAQPHEWLVVVLEKSADFERSFRGESLSPDTVWLLQRLGVLNQVREQRIIEVAGTELVQDGELPMRVNFADCDSVRLPIEVPQPMLLRTLAGAAAVYPHFMLVRSAGATELLRSGGKVTGVSARTPDGRIEVPARLTVGADGRYSNVLDWSGLAVRKLPMDRDALWFMVPCPDVWANDTYRLRFAGAGHAIRIPTGGHALSRPDAGTALQQACSAFQQIRAPQVARSRALQLRQEKMSARSAPPARASRRASYRIIDRNPGLKRRIRRDLYYTLSPRVEPARQPVRST